MDQVEAQSLANAFVSFIASGDLSVLEMVSPDFYDNVNDKRGLAIFKVVGDWFEESFSERRVDLHLVTYTDDKVVIWYTAHGRHVGAGFPRLKGLPIKGNEVTWPQVHIFRLAGGLVVEHWAVRDDAAMLDAVMA
ncbi:MAG: hypothetical protein QOF17_1366 [Solirubrobacteraceae bacterium]|jgi:lactoylglutathione lyase|nr:hypothetical protein [Solirubrobacteraceae bacterium]